MNFFNLRRNKSGEDRDDVSSNASSSHSRESSPVLEHNTFSTGGVMPFSSLPVEHNDRLPSFRLRGQLRGNPFGTHQ